MIRVLIINDSLIAKEALRRIVCSDPGMAIAGIAGDGEEGIRLAKSCRPDAILMDIRMPNVDGVDAVKEIMFRSPAPILIVTASLKVHMSHIFDCLRFGALEVIKTPSAAAGGELLKRIRIVASLKHTVQKRPNGFAAEADAPKMPPSTPVIPPKLSSKKIVAIGASTGGPYALLKVLQGLPTSLNAAVVLVQHIDAEFAPGLAEWLTGNSKFKVVTARDGESLAGGVVYLAAEKRDLIVTEDFLLAYHEAKPGSIYVPSIDATFESVASVYGANATGALLTGMGTDGALGLKSIRNAGGFTITQDEATSLIYGMPKAAKEMGSAEVIMPLHRIAEKICESLSGPRR